MAAKIFSGNIKSPYRNDIGFSEEKNLYKGKQIPFIYGSGTGYAVLPYLPTIIIPYRDEISKRKKSPQEAVRILFFTRMIHFRRGVAGLSSTIQADCIISAGTQTRKKILAEGNEQESFSEVGFII